MPTPKFLDPEANAKLMAGMTAQEFGILVAQIIVEKPHSPYYGLVSYVFEKKTGWGPDTSDQVKELVERIAKEAM